jgi:hypothetical protein
MEERMHTQNAEQLLMEDRPTMFGSMPLSSRNEWIRLAERIPWEVLEEQYAARFPNQKGGPAHPARMALAALLIKELYGFSDENVVREIMMNPYLQYFLGLREYRYAAPFDARMLTRFRRQITLEMLEWMKDFVKDAAGNA